MTQTKAFFGFCRLVGPLATLLFFAAPASAETAVCRLASPGRSIEVPGDCGRHSIRVKNGNCKADCQVFEKISNYAVDLSNVGATTGRRMWTEGAKHTFTFSTVNVNDSSWLGMSCNGLNRDRNGRECNAYYEKVKSMVFKDDFKAYCPDSSKAEFRKQGLVVNPNQMCSEYDPTLKCSSLHPSYNNYGDGYCPSSYSNDPDCDGYGYSEGQLYAYEQCVRMYTAQYDRCYDQVVKSPENSNLGETDCYCKSEDEYYKFDTSVGAWRCVPCSQGFRPGFKQDRTTGTSCVSPCPASQTWDPKTNRCMAKTDCTLTPGMEIRGGECKPSCASLGKTMDPVTQECKEACANGLVPDASGLCACDMRDFATGSAPRLPVRLSALPNVKYQVWSPVGSVPQSDNPDQNVSCACSGGPGTGVSMIDFAEGITDAQAATLPYGPVSIVAGTVPAGGGTLRNIYTCGCPNLNERFQLDASTGRWRCMPALRPDASGNGVVLKSIPNAVADLSNAATRAEVGIIDSLSDQPMRLQASLRSQTMAQDFKVPYRRQVWRCADGFERNPGTNQCESIALTPNLLASRHACSDTTPEPSSQYLTNPTAATNFDRLTNRRLACCLGQKVDPADPTKFHCLATDPGAYANFDDYYNAGSSGSGVDFAGVRFPNRLFLRDSNQRPVPGVYTKEGTRCPVLDTLSPSAQLAALNTIRTNVQSDPRANPFRGIAGVNANVGQQQECRFLVRTALEVVCPPPGVDPTTGDEKTVEVASSDGTYRSSWPAAGGNRVRRCFQPEALRVHYAIEDFSDPNQTRRGAIRTISSVGQSATEPAGSVDIQRLIRQNN